MEQEQHDKLQYFINKISTSPKDREAFLSDPVGVVQSNFAIPESPAKPDVGLTNSILLSVLKSPSAIEKIAETNSQYKANTITLEKFRQLSTEAVWDASSEDVKRKILAHWGRDYPLPHGVDPMFGIANLVVAVESAAVLTEFVIHNTEYITSGRSQLDQAELTNVVNALSRGQ